MEKRNKIPKILVVDDIEENILSVYAILEHLEVEIASATSGKEALRQCDKHNFDLILSDVQMPEMTGYDLISELKKREDTRHIPVLFLTALGRDESTAVKGYQLGAIDFVFKPINADILMLKVKNVLQNNKVILEKEKVENELKFKTNFLSNISHELRTPLNGIMGMLELLEPELRNVSEDGQEYFGMIRQSSKNLFSLVRNMLDLTKLEANQLVNSPTITEISDLAEDLKEEFKHLVANRTLDLVVLVDKQVPATVSLDRLKLKKTISNLIHNSLKHSIGIGAVTVNIKVDDKDSDHLLFEVIDTGLGIPEEEIKNIFGSVYNAVASNLVNSVDSGIGGVGILMTRYLVEIMGGTLNCESKLGAYANFYFSIPVEIVETPVEEEVKDKKTKHILIVEDIIVNQKVVQMMLVSIGCTYDTVSNGQECLDVYESDKYDLILMDIMMPDMDGITATKKLRESHSDLPPIVALSAAGLEDNRKHYLSIGLDDYLSKPLQLKELVNILNKY